MLLAEDVCVVLEVGACVAVRDTEPVAVGAHGSRLRGAARRGARGRGRLAHVVSVLPHGLCDTVTPNE